MKVTKTNPLLNEDLKKRSTSIIHKFSTHGVSVIDKISLQEKYDLMMTILDKEPEDRSDSEINIIYYVVQDIRFFRDIKQSMSDGEQTCQQLCRYMQGYFLPCEKVLFKQGDKGDTFWIIIKGEVSIYKRVFQRHDEVKHQSEAEKNKDAIEGVPGVPEEEGEFVEKEIVRLGSGNCFGEFALNPDKNKRRLASVMTTMDTFFGFIPGNKIVDIIYKANSASFIEIFSNVKLFNGRSYELLKQFYDVSEEIQIYKNNVVYNIRDTPQFVYFIKQGEFSIQVDRNGNNEFVPLDHSMQIIEDTSATSRKILKKQFQTSERGKYVELKILGQGECFGEEEILRQKEATFARIYRVVCRSEQGQLYAIPRKQILRLMMLFPQVYKVAFSQVKNKEAARQIRFEQLKLKQINDISPIQSSQDLSISTNQGLNMKMIEDSLRSPNTIKGSSGMNTPSKATSNNTATQWVEEGIIENQKTNNISQQIKSPRLNAVQNLGRILKSSSGSSIFEQNSQKLQSPRNHEFAEDKLKNSDATEDTNLILKQKKSAMNSNFFNNPLSSRSNSLQDPLVQETSKNTQFQQFAAEKKTETANEHPSRSTLLYEESIKKKKKKNTQSLGSAAFEGNYLKEFAQKYKIPLKELQYQTKLTRNSSKEPSDHTNNSMLSSQEQNTLEQNNSPQHSLNICKGNSMINNNPPSSPSLFKNNSEFFCSSFSRQPSLTQQSLLIPHIVNTLSINNSPRTKNTFSISSSIRQHFPFLKQVETEKTTSVAAGTFDKKLLKLSQQISQEQFKMLQLIGQPSSDDPTGYNSRSKVDSIDQNLNSQTIPFSLPSSPVLSKFNSLSLSQKKYPLLEDSPGLEQPFPLSLRSSLSSASFNYLSAPGNKQYDQKTIFNSHRGTIPSIYQQVSSPRSHTKLDSLLPSQTFQQQQCCSQYDKGTSPMHGNTPKSPSKDISPKIDSFQTVFSISRRKNAQQKNSSPRPYLSSFQNVGQPPFLLKEAAEDIYKQNQSLTARIKKSCLSDKSPKLDSLDKNFLKNQYFEGQDNASKVDIISNHSKDNNYGSTHKKQNSMNVK